TGDMRELRRRIVAEHRAVPPREVVVPDPTRDPEVAAVDYDRAVSDWHAERARRVVTALDSLDDDEVAAFLVWGDPSLYDSTLRIRRRPRDAGPWFSVQVCAGATRPAAAPPASGAGGHRVGGPGRITAGSRLASTAPEALRTAVAMLPAHCAFRTVAGPETHI